MISKSLPKALDRFNWRRQNQPHEGAHHHNVSTIHNYINNIFEDCDTSGDK
ncbi:MAG: hypothetical protein ACJ71K_22385 [Nitrososphaeraceae archaeon]